jgi:hypothetical protein
MPESRPMPGIVTNCQELRVIDGNVTWRARHFGVVAGLGRGHDIRGDQNVILQQRGELVAGIAAVVFGDRISDVGLILEQTLRGNVLVG